MHPFATSSEWETIRPKLPNFNFDRIAQLSCLIANKREEDFGLWMDWIGLV